MLKLSLRQDLDRSNSTLEIVVFSFACFLWLACNRTTVLDYGDRAVLWTRKRILVSLSLHHRI